MSEPEGACSILDMDTKVQLKWTLTSFTPAVVHSNRNSVRAPAPDIAFALTKAVLLHGLRYTFE